MTLRAHEGEHRRQDGRSSRCDPFPAAGGAQTRLQVHSRRRSAGDRTEREEPGFHLSPTRAAREDFSHKTARPGSKAAPTPDKRNFTHPRILPKARGKEDGGLSEERRRVSLRVARERTPRGVEIRLNARRTLPTESTKRPGGRPEACGKKPRGRQTKRGTTVRMGSFPRLPPWAFRQHHPSEASSFAIVERVS